MTTAVRMPQRIQRQRVKGWRAPEGCVYVGRGSRWGNPFRVGTWYPDGDPVELQRRATRQDIVDQFDDYAHGLLVTKPSFTVEDIRRELAGRDLACWCKPSQACHADLLIRIAAGVEFDHA